LPEKALGGLNEKAVKLSRPGMHLTVAEVDFTPTLAEQEAVRESLRKQLMEKVAAELKSVNAAFPGRDFRVSEVSFGGIRPMMAAKAQMFREALAQNAAVADAAMAPGGEVQTAQKLTLSASVTFAALAPVK
ncbi:MAG TPA: hypothetical protein VHB73_03980, partial [Alphaproteobacteria bacterium]|nr:hypothetical protein [Alphaproteobacteria bacterium]